MKSGNITFLGLIAISMVMLFMPSKIPGSIFSAVSISVIFLFVFLLLTVVGFE